MARTTIRSTAHESVVLRTRDPDDPGARIEREFRCPDGGGYVREFRDGEWKDACHGLKSLGPRLWSHSRAALLDVIRREWARARTNNSRMEEREYGDDE